jgi:hypothetical protein
MKKQNIKEISNNIIEKNIVKHNGSSIIMAGGSTYHAFWSRDFLYSAEILMKNPKWRSSVKDSIDLILSFMKKKNNFLPKGIDTMFFEWRIVRGSIRTFFKMKPEKLDHKGLWKTLYKDNIGSHAVDTNLLLIRGAMALYKYPEYEEYVESIKDDLIKVLRYYNISGLINNYTDQLIKQPDFSDWKDSLKRSGVTFLTNLLYWRTLKDMEESNLFENIPSSELIKNRLNSKFFDKEKGVYYEILKPNISKNYRFPCETKEYFGLDENLLAIYWDFVTGTKALVLYENLKCRPEWSRFPALCESPKHPWYEKPFHVLLVGIDGYHDTCYWSWVLALASIVSYKVGDTFEGRRIKNLLDIIVVRDQTIYDAYEKKKIYRSNGSASYDLFQFKRRGFYAEFDWTWGAAYVLEMLNYENESLKISKL